MKATVKLYTNDGETAEGFPVKLIISHNGKTKRITLGHSLVEYWDAVYQLPKVTHPYFDSLYGFIYEIRSRAGSRSFNKYTNFEQAQEYLLQEKTQINTPLYDYFNVEIERLKKQGRFGTADTYKYARNVFERYAPGRYLQSIDRKFVRTFKAKMQNKVSDKTLIEYIGTLRALVNKALEDPEIKIEDNGAFVNATKGLVRRKRRQKQRYLEREDLKRFALAKLSIAREEEARDFSMLQFYLGGINLKDLYFLKTKKFFKDRVMLERSKLGKYSFEYDLLVVPQARTILEKYTDFSGEYVFDFRMDHTAYKTYRRRHNVKLRNIQERLNLNLVPIDEPLNSNTFRHCFATYGKRLFIDNDILDELQGREESRIIRGYQPEHLEQVRDEAHLKIVNW